MPDKTKNSLINLNANVNVNVNGDVINNFINKVAKGMGILYEPYQIERIAKAESKAAIIKVQTEIQNSELQQRASNRLISEEAQKQKNMEDIMNQAISYLTEDANADQIDDDWMTNFFDKSRIISDNKMQKLWARILAGEANKPGTYSKRTVNFINDFDKIDADAFTKLCGFCWNIGEVRPIITYNAGLTIYKDNGVTLETIRHLESIGLVKCDLLPNEFSLRNLPKIFVIEYYGRPLSIEMEKESDNRLRLGQVIFTKIGKELFPICGSNPVEGFYEYMKRSWNV